MKKLKKNFFIIDNNDEINDENQNNISSNVDESLQKKNINKNKRGNGKKIDYSSLDNFLKSIGDIGSNIFISLHSNKEWEELKSSQEAIDKEDVKTIRNIRMKRQKQLIEDGCSTNVDEWDRNVIKEFMGLISNVHKKLVEMEHDEEENESNEGKESSRSRSRSFTFKNKKKIKKKDM